MTHKLEHIPNSETIEWKQAFIDKYSELTDFEEFKKYCLSFLRKAIRVNTIKISVEELKKKLEPDWELEPIPWCEQGFWIKGKRRDIGNLLEHALGYFYVQESVSMIPALALDPKKGEKVLDMAAAPGSKTTQIGAMMDNTGLVVANDIDKSRLPVLKLNTQKSGLTNCVITHMRAEAIKDLKFDKILLDAPCSGTGTIRKSLKTITMWNPNALKGIVKTQKKLIDNAFELLKKGGVMTYSTCSLEPEENEEVIDYFLDTHKNAKLENIDLNINHKSTVLEYKNKKLNPEVKKCLRLWPQDNNTGGFFVAKIKKL